MFVYALRDRGGLGSYSPNQTPRPGGASQHGPAVQELQWADANDTINREAKYLESCKILNK